MSKLLLSLLSSSSSKKDGFEIELWNSSNQSGITQIMKSMKTKPTDTTQHSYRSDKSNMFYLEFDGDIQASGSDKFKQELMACIQIAKPDDVFLISIESSGGSVSNYGELYSVIDLIKKKGVCKLWVVVDKIAASGGYLMSLPADRIYANEFSMIGSIGVLSGVPNVEGLLNKYGIKMEEYTAGERKMNISMFRDNSEEQKEYHRNKLVKIHQLFKNQLIKHRGEVIKDLGVDINTLMEGDVWMGDEALRLGLVDELKSSVEILLDEKERYNIMKINYHNSKDKNGIMNMLKPKMLLKKHNVNKFVGLMMNVMRSNHMNYD